MKTILKTVTLLLAAALLLCACQSPSASPEPAVTPGTADGGSAAESDFAALLIKAGTLVVGTSPDYAPYESLENGKLVGFDIEMTEAVAAIMGLKVEWSQMDFDNILIAVPAGQVDIGVSAFTYREDRAQSVLFNKTPYLKSAQVAFVKADSDIQTVEDFPGHHFYAGLNTTGEMALDEVAEALGELEKTTSMDYQIAFEMLNQGQLDGVVCDKAVGEGYIQTMGLRSIEPPLVDEENLIITRKGNEMLVEALDKAIVEYMATEGYQALRLKYGL